MRSRTTVVCRDRPQAMRSRLGALTLLFLAGVALVACTNAEGTPVDEQSASAPPAPATEKPEQSAEPTAAPVEAVIVVAGADVDGLNVSASGYVSGVVESTGTCTFTFTRLDALVESTRDAVANVTDTSCGLAQIPIDQFQRGTWQVILTYRSGELTVTSPPTDLEIP